MTVGHSSAIEQALALLRAPALLAAVRQRPLPGDLPQLFRLAAGDGELFEQVESATGEPHAQLAEAATFYLQQVLFAPGADSYRVLGVAPDAADEQIKQHYRLLLRWLHPDRNHDEWDAVYADRVNRAWQDLRTPERRAQYDRSDNRGAGPAVIGMHLGVAPLRPPAGHGLQQPMLSSRAVRRLPVLVLGGLGVAAAAVLGLAWHLQRIETQAVSAVRADSSLPVPAAEDAAPTPRLPASNRELPAVPATADTPELPPSPPEAPTITEVASAPLEPAEPIASNIDAPSSPRIAGPGRPVATQPTLAAAAADTAGTTATGPERPATVPQAHVAQLPSKPRPDSADAPVVDVAIPDVVAVAPASFEPPAATPAVPPALDEAMARAVLERFSAAYANGDLPALLSLFTRDARNNRGGLDAIADDYAELFNSSDNRRIELLDPIWLGEGGRGSVTAQFRATVLPRGTLRAQRVDGDIRFDLRLEGDVVRIERMRHQ